MTQGIRGFYGYYWRPYWGRRTHNYEYVHSKFQPESDNPPFKITVDTLKRASSLDDPDTLLFQINGKGRGIKKQFRVVSRMEKSLGEIFAELVQDRENLELIFDGIFKNK